MKQFFEFIIAAVFGKNFSMIPVPVKHTVQSPEITRIR